MSAKVKHIHLPYTTYQLCKKDGGISSNKTNANCKTCLKMYKRYKDMIKELQEVNRTAFNMDEPCKILKKYDFI